MQQHFADEDSECTLIMMLANSQEELKTLLLNEIVYIKRLLPLHEFWTLRRLIPKLKGENKKIALKVMKQHMNETDKKSDVKIMWLQSYYDVCTGKKEKASIYEQIVEMAADLTHDFELRDLYKKIPDQRIADLWLIKLEKTNEFRFLVNAALITKQDAFFEKAKLKKICAVDSDTMHMLRDKYTEHKDERLLDLWLHALKIFHERGGSNIVSYSMEAYTFTNDLRFLDFIQPHLKWYSQKVEFYALRPTPGMLDTLKKECDSFGDAKGALFVTGDEFFLEKAKIYLNMEYGLKRVRELYQKLMEDQKKHKKHLQDLDIFIKENLDELWKNCENTGDKAKFLKLM